MFHPSIERFELELKLELPLFSGFIITTQLIEWNEINSNFDSNIYLKGLFCCPWSHGLRQISFKLVWRCHQLLSGFLSKDSECHISHVCWLMIRIMRWYQGLWTDLLVCALRLSKISARRPSDKGCVTSHHLKWGPIPLNEVSRIAQHIRNGKGRKEGNDMSM